MMDAGTILFQSSGGFGPNIGQLQKEMEDFGKVVRIKDAPLEQIPEPARDFDFLLEVKNFFSTRYLAARLTDAGPVTVPAGSEAPLTDSDGREVRRYAIEFLASPYRNVEKIVNSIKAKYNA